MAAVAVAAAAVSGWALAGLLNHPSPGSIQDAPIRFDNTKCNSSFSSGSQFEYLPGYGSESAKLALESARVDASSTFRNELELLSPRPVEGAPDHIAAVMVDKSGTPQGEAVVTAVDGKWQINSLQVCAPSAPPKDEPVISSSKVALPN